MEAFDINTIDTSKIVIKSSEESTSSAVKDVSDGGEQGGTPDSQENKTEKGNAIQGEDPNTAGAATTGGNGKSEQTPDPDKSGEEKADVDFDEVIKIKTGGRIDTLSSVEALINELDQLREEVKKPSEPQFPSDRAKKAYEFLLSREGDFGDLTQQMHYVMALGDPTKMVPKQAQLEAFILERSDLTRDRAEKLFNARYEKIFGEMDEDDILTMDEHDRQTKASVETIQKMQDSFSVKAKSDREIQEKTESELPKVISSVDGTIQKFSGIELALGENKSEKLKIGMVGSEEMKAVSKSLKDAMVDPGAFMGKIIDGLKTSDGNFNYDGWANAMFKFVAFDQIVQKVGEHMYAAGQESKLKEKSNLSTGKNHLGQPAVEHKSMWDVAAEAHAKRGSN